MRSAAIENILREKFESLRAELDERARRLWAATEAKAIGRGGVAAVVRATGIARSTVRRALQELQGSVSATPQQSVGKLKRRRVRRVGGGRKRISEKDPQLIAALDALVEPTSRGDPTSPLRWTCKSTRKLAEELTTMGHPVSHAKVGALLGDLNYSLQATRKTTEGQSHPDRNAQFEHIIKNVEAFQQRKQPVVSVDTKKKELVGDFANKGREYQPKGHPEKVRTHDFMDKELGKAIPYGVYDITQNDGWVSVGKDHDTAQFAVETLRRWWHQMGRKVYPDARELLITADGGGSNGSRIRLWKLELQRLADETGLSISVCHFPPGTSKWNKIEHRMFSHITQNWRGRPLTSHEVIVNLIANTTTTTGLRIAAELDDGEYPTKLKVSDKQMKELNIHRCRFHGKDWNYTIKPRNQ